VRSRSRSRSRRRSRTRTRRRQRRSSWRRQGRRTTREEEQGMDLIMGTWEDGGIGMEIGAPITGRRRRRRGAWAWPRSIDRVDAHARMFCEQIAQ
jgi:hypothetical protein